MQISESKMEYLKLLAKTYRTEEETAAEIINLTAIQNLPKGTDYFLSDIHGEFGAFMHIIRNASGTIRRKIEENFPELTPEKRRSLATLVYYPEEKLELLKASAADRDNMYRGVLRDLVKLLEIVSVKFTRSYVRKKMPAKLAYTIEELLYGKELAAVASATDHRANIINSIVEIGYADEFVKAIADLISDLCVYRLHILGDVYDRGADGNKVLDAIINYHSADVQWGNHDILWMGAAAGSAACIANVVRNCTKYDSVHALEVGYGISLRTLETFALKTYPGDESPMVRAIAIIQFKLEGQLIDAHPYYEMDDLKLLHKINHKDGTIELDGKVYPLKNPSFPTIDPAHPYELTGEEAEVMDSLTKEFLESSTLQNHVRYLFTNGSMYKKLNGNLLFHGCMPLTPDGELDYINTSDGPKKGREWFDYAEKLVRKGYFAKGGRDKQRGIDLCWYLWCGYKSPLFGKKKITTFERLYIEDQETWKEEKNPYYTLVDRVDVVERILAEFGCDAENGIIINGHMPVKKGANPIHAGGRAMVIDGGFAKAYQKTTGIAGYSLVQNSYGFILSAHEPFVSKEKAITDELDIHSTQVAKENITKRILNKDTDEGRERAETIESLKLLLEAYRSGLIRQEASAK